MPTARAAWLEAPAVDLTLIVGVLGVAGGFAAVVARAPQLFLPVLGVHTWLFAFAHVVATFTRLGAVPADRRRHRWLLFGLPPLLFVLTLLVGGLGGVGALCTTYFVLQWFHTVRQSWGLAQHYRRAAGGLAWDPAWLSELTIWSLPIVGLLHRSAEQPRTFLFMPIWLPRVPASMIAVAGLVTLALLAGFAWTRVAAWRAGRLSLPHTLFVGSHFVVYGAGYLWIDDLHAGWLLVNVWHNVQYLAYVWMRNRARFADGEQHDAPILSWLCQPGVGRGIAYFAASLAVSTPVFAGVLALGARLDEWLAPWRAATPMALLPMALVLVLTINFHHYLVDAVIWRRPRAA